MAQPYPAGAAPSSQTYGSQAGYPPTAGYNPPAPASQPPGGPPQNYGPWPGEVATAAPPVGFPGSPPPPPGSGAAPYPTAGATGSYPGSPMSPGAHIGPYPPGVQPALSSPPGVESPTYTGPVGPELVGDGTMTEPQPTAPPMEKMDNIPGYGNLSFDISPLPPPSYGEATRIPKPERREFTNVPSITEEEAREALLQFVAEKCCYGKGAARELTFLDLISSSAFHYTLETFGESRSTAWTYEPFKGQPVDTAINGPAPGPWDISVSFNEKFKNGVAKIEVPHTASVKPCHVCVGNGRVRCFRCVGRGRVICETCNGTGKVKESFDHDDHDHHHHHGDHHHHGGHHHHDHSHHKPCSFCNGSGRRRCHTCHGHGQTGCKTCDAVGNLKCFIQLTVRWNNHLEDHIVERTALPTELIRGVTGQTAFEEEYPRVWPIVHFPDQAINVASKRLVERHSNAFPNERMLMQRHRVRIVPVTQALYKWKEDDSRSFYVYGFEHRVHAPDYPQQCCCGCTIL